MRINCDKLSKNNNNKHFKTLYDTIVAYWNTLSIEKNKKNKHLTPYIFDFNIFAWPVGWGYLSDISLRRDS